MTLTSWLKTLPPGDQDVFFKEAARFFSNRELSAIIKEIRCGRSLYAAHVRTGVLSRHEVDLENLRRGWGRRDSAVI